ncbi:hypothetical protein [Propionibacterium sp.]|uniref:hypothetical protein n=1 Tax=Propionibacterium sp. TaxID=1977903 RepID=UPI0039E9CC26
MPRRVSLPGADELFRPTEDEHEQEPASGMVTRSSTDGMFEGVSSKDAGKRYSGARNSAGRKSLADSGSSGRVRHDEKITIYLSNEELLGLEQARLTLRARHGITVDRGRLVREAIAMALNGLTEQGENAPLVLRLDGTTTTDPDQSGHDRHDGPGD